MVPKYAFIILDSTPLAPQLRPEENTPTFTEKFRLYRSHERRPTLATRAL
jgi:hypothetical protein